MKMVKKFQNSQVKMEKNLRKIFQATALWKLNHFQTEMLSIFTIKVTPPAPTPSPVPQPNPGNQNITIWTDENGNPVKPSEPGSKEPGTIPDYEYVKTVTVKMEVSDISSEKFKLQLQLNQVNQYNR